MPYPSPTVTLQLHCEQLWTFIVIVTFDLHYCACVRTNRQTRTITGIFQLVVQKSRRESAHARPFGGNFELKILRMRGFSSRFLDNQLENPCIQYIR